MLPINLFIDGRYFTSLVVADHLVMMQQILKMWSNFVCPLGPFLLAQSQIKLLLLLYSHHMYICMSLVRHRY